MVRLELLNLTQLKALAVSPSRLSGIPIADGALPPGFILSAAIEALADNKPQLWYSVFVFVQEQPARVVGSGGFKGAPVGGRVEIGYGVADQYRSMGIATAAVLQLLPLAFLDPDVREVYAENATGNLPSRRVLEKAGFRYVGQRNTEEDGIVDRWVMTR